MALIVYTIIRVMAKVARMTYGLKRRQTYEEVIDYIENDNDNIRNPDRTAKQLRHTFELSQLDGVGMQLMEQQQFREIKEQEKEHLLRQIASTTGISITEARATQQSPQQNTTKFQTLQDRHNLIRLGLVNGCRALGLGQCCGDCLGQEQNIMI